jgi:hypothetical protein
MEDELEGSKTKSIHAFIHWINIYQAPTGVGHLSSCYDIQAGSSSYERYILLCVKIESTVQGQIGSCLLQHRWEIMKTETSAKTRGDEVKNEYKSFFICIDMS